MTDIEHKLEALMTKNPWMKPQRMQTAARALLQERSSTSVKRGKIIKIANAVTEALAPHVACRPGCSHCCHLNTMIYEHEAVALAAITGRRMVKLKYRPPHMVATDGMKFNGKPCPFLVNDKCSVYEHRPLVCRVHHSLNDDDTACKLSWDPNAARPLMYDPDLVELPYALLSMKTREPMGNIAEFFPE